MKTLTFNTGRAYTENGQRIAAAQLESGHVILVDIDRQLDIMLPDSVEFTQRDIMRAYDSSNYTYASAIGLAYGDYYDIVRQLRDAADDVEKGTK
jgi:hypothetical protein